MSPAVLQNAGVNSSSQGGDYGAGAAPNEALQRAFNQGAEYAAEQLRQQQVEQEAGRRQQLLEDLEASNAEAARKLRERTDTLQKREYRAPAQPLACKDERQATLLCFRETRGAEPGEIVTKCQQVAEELERCAAMVRAASTSKIVAGVLESTSAQQ